jgi:MFS family permease
LILPVTAIGVAIGLPAFRRLTPPGTLHARPGLPAAISVRGLLTSSFFMADAYVPLMLTTIRKGGTGITVIALTASSCLWTAGSWVQERRIGRWGPRMLVRVGFVFVTVGIGLLAVTLLPGVPPAFGILAWAIGGLGIGMAYSPLSVTTLAEAGAGREGRASSALQLSDVLGVTLGIGLGGAFIAAGADRGWAGSSTLWLVFACAGAVSLLGGALSVRLPRHLTDRSPEAVAELEHADLARPAMPRETSSQFPHS